MGLSFANLWNEFYVILIWLWAFVVVLAPNLPVFAALMNVFYLSSLLSWRENHYLNYSLMMTSFMKYMCAKKFVSQFKLRYSAGGKTLVSNFSVHFFIHKKCIEQYVDEFGNSFTCWIIFVITIFHPHSHFQEIQFYQSK